MAVNCKLKLKNKMNLFCKKMRIDVVKSEKMFRMYFILAVQILPIPATCWSNKKPVP